MLLHQYRDTNGRRIVIQIGGGFLGTPLKKGVGVKKPIKQGVLESAPLIKGVNLHPFIKRVRVVRVHSFRKHLFREIQTKFS